MRYDDLVQLYRRTRDTPILSVYLPGPIRDPAQRGEPGTLLDAGLSRLRRGLAVAPHGDREMLAAASGFARAALRWPSCPREGAGVAMFVGADGVHHLGELLAPTPFLVEWRNGIVVAPYLRTLKHCRPAIAALVDSRRARVFRWSDAALTPLGEFDADVRVDEPVHMGDAPRPTFHPGTRGLTGADETARREDAAFARLVGRVAARVETLAQPNAWVIAGGMARGARALVAALPPGLGSRTQVVSGLTTGSSDAELIEVLRRAVSELGRHHDGSLVEKLIDRATSGPRAGWGLLGGRSAIGWSETLAVLEARAAHEVLISAGLIETAPARAEIAARMAMDSGACIEVVSGEGAVRLDAECEGVACELRFAVAAPAFDRASEVALA
jgi:hypothetical protein